MAVCGDGVVCVGGRGGGAGDVGGGECGGGECGEEVGGGGGGVRVDVEEGGIMDMSGGSHATVRCNKTTALGEMSAFYVSDLRCLCSGTGI